jgi:hypothetical protein
MIFENKIFDKREGLVKIRIMGKELKSFLRYENKGGTKMSDRTKQMFLCIMACQCLFVIPVFGSNIVRFGDFDGPKTLSDTNLVPVTFNLTGGGYGEVSDDGIFSEVILYDTTGKSVFSIETPSKQNTSVGDIIVEGPLKSITARSTDLQGDITIDSNLGSLILNNVSGNRTITIGSSSNPKAGVLMKFNRISDLHIHSEMPIKMLRAVEWLDTDETADDINAPSLGTVNITGNKKLGFSGDFEPNIIITGAGTDPTKPVLGSVKISGVLGTGGNTSIINGDVRSIKAGQLRGNLLIIGNAGSVKSSQPMAILPPESGEIGTLDVTGTANVRCGKDRIKFTDDLLYSSEPNLYRLEDLRLYDVVGASWNYNCTYKIGGAVRDSGTGTSNVQVEDYHNTGDSNYYDISMSAEGMDISTAWTEDVNGIHLDSWGTDGDAGSYNMSLNSPLVAPKYLQLRKQYTDSGTFSGDVDIEGITGSIDGVARTSCKLLGHEQVAVPAGTFVAAKVTVGVTMSGTMTLDLSDYGYGIVNGRYSVSETQTWWGVPEVGAVKAMTKMTIHISAAGEGSASLTIIETDELTSGP